MIYTEFFYPIQEYIAAKFIKENNLTGTRIIGYEFVKQNLEEVNNDIIDFLIHQKPEDQGYIEIGYLCKKVALSEAFTDLYYMPLEIIMQENCTKTAL